MRRIVTFTARRPTRTGTAWQTRAGDPREPDVHSDRSCLRCSAQPAGFKLPLAPEVRSGKIDDLVAAAAEDRPDHEDAERSHLVEADPASTGDLPPVHGHLD